MAGGHMTVECRQGHHDACASGVDTGGFCTCTHHGAAKPPVLVCANPLHAVFRYCPSPDECSNDYEMTEAE